MRFEQQDSEVVRSVLPPRLQKSPFWSFELVVGLGARLGGWQGWFHGGIAWDSKECLLFGRKSRARGDGSAKTCGYDLPRGWDGLGWLVGTVVPG
jgi:hypothetical protein